jgi:8-oxo-dGTP pyrophosphatase MutT (NUDIX family)
VYPGLWEFGPSGGVDPPPPERTRLTADELAAALAREADEEAGIDLRPGAADVELVALLTDDHARSVDLVARCRLRKPIDHRRAGVCAAASEAAGRWEYVDAAWLTGEELAAFARDHAEAIAPPTRVMIEDAGLLKR